MSGNADFVRRMQLAEMQRKLHGRLVIVKELPGAKDNDC